MYSLIEFYNEVKDDANVKYIAFDIFDTIIKRKVHPEYIKHIWARRLCMSIELNFDKKQLYKMRNEIEASLCNENLNKFGVLEFRYEDLISQLYNELSLTMDFEAFFTLCKEIEFNIEKTVQELNADVVSLIKNNDKKIILISDFYLPKEIIFNFIKMHNLDKFIDGFYVSSELMKTKREGNLYDFVLNDLKIEPSNIVMIGDNIHSDYNVPVKKGIRAYRIDRQEDTEKYNNFLEKHLDKEFVKKITKTVDIKEIETFENIAFSLYSFTQLLYEELLRKKCKDVFFLSREGEPLKKFFDIFREKMGFVGNEFINSHYLMVSRKATFIPSLKSLEEEDFEILFRQYRYISLYEFLSSLNFNEELIDEIARILLVNKNIKQTDFKTSEVFRALKNNDIFKENYEKIRLQQKEYFYNYLQSFGVNYKENGLYIVDVGWKGTIQDNIYNIFNGNQEIYGYYMGLVALGNVSENNHKEGLLFYCKENEKSKYFDIYNENRSLFEMVLAASHGSATSYEFSGGEYFALLHHEEKEIELYKNLISPILERAMEKFIEICSYFSFSAIDYDDYAGVFAFIHSRMVLYPTKEEVNFFRNMYHFENFGFFEYSTFAVKNISLKERVLNLARFIKNPSYIINSGFWAILTLEDKGLGFLKPLYSKFRMKNFKL